MEAIRDSTDEEKDLDSDWRLSGPNPDLLHPHLSPSDPYTPDPLEHLSSESHQSLLDGAQPGSLVQDGVPDAARACEPVPLGAHANGPASHGIAEKPDCPNKELHDPDTKEDTDTASPSELQPNCPKPVRLIPKPRPAREPSVFDGSDSDSEPPIAVLSGDWSNEPPVRQDWARKGLRGGSLWDVDSESSESSWDTLDELSWDPGEEFRQFLLNGSTKDGDDVSRTSKVTEFPSPISQRHRKRKMLLTERVGASGKVYNSFSYMSQTSPTGESSDFETSTTKEHGPTRKTTSKAPTFSSLENSVNQAVGMEELLSSEKEEKWRDRESVVSERDAFAGGGPEHEPTTDSDDEPEPSFFPCTKCNVNFKEKRHLHRHMMYHLDGHNQARLADVPRPFICRECGRSFRDRGSLQKHMVIHQARRQRLMEEIKGLNGLQDEGRGAKLQCPQCVFGTNCPKTFVQHAKTHEKDKRYYCCERCDHMAATELELEAHQRTVHPELPKNLNGLLSLAESDGANLDVKAKNFLRPVMFFCKICRFSTQNQNILRKHVELIHRRAFCDNYDSSAHNLDKKQKRAAGKTKTADSSLFPLKPKPHMEKQALRTEPQMPFVSNGAADDSERNGSTLKAHNGLSSSLFPWRLGDSARKLSPSFASSDRPAKLSPLPSDKIDITTGLPYTEEDNQDYGSTISEKRTKYPASFGLYLTTKTDLSGKATYPSHASKESQGDTNHHTSGVLPLNYKTPSKRKMSVPYRNTTETIPHRMDPKQEPTSPDHKMTDHRDRVSHEDAFGFSDYTESTAKHLEGSRDRQNFHLFIRRHRIPLWKENMAFTPGQSDNFEDESDEIQTFIVKEECIESAVSMEEPSDSLVRPQNDAFVEFADVSTPFESGKKACPYCPAMFESGVGLSNHVRGHLHRVGLSYDARHVVSPEQVASQDRQPRIRRRISGAPHGIRKVERPGAQTDHTCPLCWGWFDTKTGLSNHVRGHLKRIGRPISGASKSPLSILNELLRDEGERRNILRALGGKQRLSRPFVSQKFAGSDGLFLTPTGIPVKIQHTAGLPGTGYRVNGERRRRVEEEDDEEMKDEGESHASALVDLLKKRRMDGEMEPWDGVLAEKKDFSSSSISRAGTQAVKMDPIWRQEKGDINKKVCIHCNTAFPSAVSLSNHLRAYARRQRIALLEGTTYDCRQRKPRSRAGQKKKTFPLAHTASEEVYRLTCRFCDLVFQGPLSVQEDWVRHLQRHLMHTCVPGSGAAMVEVRAVCEELPPPPAPERFFLPRHTPLPHPPLHQHIT